MKPVENERTKTRYVHPEYDGVTKLHLMAETIGEPDDCGVRSFWKPTEEELAELRNGGVVELVVWGVQLPPISIAGISLVDATKPFVEPTWPGAGADERDYSPETP